MPHVQTIEFPLCHNTFFYSLLQEDANVTPGLEIAIGHVLLHHPVSESDCYIGPHRAVIVCRVGLIGGQVESPVHTQPQLFPNPIFRPAAELRTDVQVIGLT